MLEAIILCGGQGTRLRSIVSDRPKPLAEVKGVPFIYFILDRLILLGIHKVVLSVGYKADSFYKLFENGYKTLEVSFSNEDVPKGTGGALRDAITLITGESFLVCNGDSFLDIDFLPNFKSVEECVILANYLCNADRFGMLNFVDDKLIGFNSSFNGLSKTDGYINAGIYLMRKCIDYKFPEGNFSLEQHFEFLIRSGRNFRVIPTKKLFIDIGVPEDYKRAELFFKQL